jgi:hypothetical protein
MAPLGLQVLPVISISFSGGAAFKELQRTEGYHWLPRSWLYSRIPYHPPCKSQMSVAPQGHNRATKQLEVEAWHLGQRSLMGGPASKMLTVEWAPAPGPGWCPSGSDPMSLAAGHKVCLPNGNAA